MGEARDEGGFDFHQAFSSERQLMAQIGQCRRHTMTVLSIADTLVTVETQNRDF